jgi:DNA-binding PadR family transcriptional regulator
LRGVLARGIRQRNIWIFRLRLPQAAGAPPMRLIWKDCFVVNEHAAATRRRRSSDRPRVREAVLGLLVEQPASAYMLSVRLRERLRAAEFPENYVYWVLDDLERQGLVARVAPERASSDLLALGSEESVRKRSNAHYEATAKGQEHFKRWLTSPSSEPRLRDELMIRIAFCGPAEVPRLIELVYAQEQVCVGHIHELRDSTEQDASWAHPKGHSAEWQQMLRVMSRDAELAHWSARVEWLQSVRELLEGLDRKGAGH